MWADMNTKKIDSKTFYNIKRYAYSILLNNE